MRLQSESISPGFLRSTPQPAGLGGLFTITSSLGPVRAAGLIGSGAYGTVVIPSLETDPWRSPKAGPKIRRALERIPPHDFVTWDVNKSVAYIVEAKSGAWVADRGPIALNVYSDLEPILGDFVRVALHPVHQKEEYEERLRYHYWNLRLSEEPTWMDYAHQSMERALPLHLRDPLLPIARQYARAVTASLILSFVEGFTQGTSPAEPLDARTVPKREHETVSPGAEAYARSLGAYGSLILTKELIWETIPNLRHLSIDRQEDLDEGGYSVIRFTITTPDPVERVLELDDQLQRAFCRLVPTRHQPYFAISYQSAT